MGSTINGYHILRLKLYKPKDKKTVADHKTRHGAIVQLRSKIKKWRLEDPKKNKRQIAQGKASLKTMQDTLRRDKELDIKNRTMHYHSLLHRLVAEYFVTPKSPKHTVVGHLDYNKMNNRVGNLNG